MIVTPTASFDCCFFLQGSSMQVQGLFGREGHRDGQDLLDGEPGLQPQSDLQV